MYTNLTGNTITIEQDCSTESTCAMLGINHLLQLKKTQTQEFLVRFLCFKLMCQSCHHLFSFFVATASQQETDAEQNSEPSVKSSGHSPGSQTLPPAAGSISDKNSSPTYMDKSKDSGGVTVT